MHTSDMDTHVHMHNCTATYMNNQNQNSSKHKNFLCRWKHNNIYNNTHVTSVLIWPKFELVQDFTSVLLPASLTKIRLKMKESARRHRFHHYKSMGAFCCNGNHSFGGICSLFPIPLMIHTKFYQDWLNDLGDSIINLLKILSALKGA